MSDSRPAFIREARKIHRDSLFNATGHFEAAQRYGRIHVIVRILIVIFGALGGLSALKDPGVGTQFQLMLVGCFSTMAGLLGGVLAVLKPAEAQSGHELAGEAVQVAAARRTACARGVRSCTRCGRDRGANLAPYGAIQRAERDSATDS